MTRDRRPRRNTTAARQAGARPRATGFRWPSLLLDVVALGLVAGLYWLTLANAWSGPLLYDEAVYLQIAQRITSTGCPISANGGGHVFLDNPPLVTYTAALARLIGGASLTWLRLVHITTLVLPGYLAVWLLARGMFGPAAAVTALLTLSTSRRFVQEAAVVKLDIPLAMISALFLLALYYLTYLTRACPPSEPLPRPLSDMERGAPEFPSSLAGSGEKGENGKEDTGNRRQETGQRGGQSAKTPGFLHAISGLLDSISGLRSPILPSVPAGKGARGLGFRRLALCAACALLAGLACVTKHQGGLLPLAGVAYLVVVRYIGASPPSARRGRPEIWILGGMAVAGVVWFSLGTVCGGNLIAAVRSNFARATFQTNEPWFHRPVLVYWQALGVAVGPIIVAGVAASIVLWRQKLLTDPRLLLLVIWAGLTFVFCTVIGLRHERYFMSAVPALAVLVGSLASADPFARLPFVGERAWLLRAAPIAVLLLVAAGTAALFPRSLADLERARRVGPRSDAFYLAVGTLARNTIPADERILCTRVQTAYIAERDYFLSEYQADAERLLATLSNPDNRITLLALDSSNVLHPAMPPAGQQRVWAYMRRHFLAVPGAPRGAGVYRRLSW